MANIVKIRLDAENKRIIMEVVDDTTGVIDTSWGSIELKLGQTGGTPTSPGMTMGKEIELREMQGCDPSTGDPRFCMTLRSPWYTTQLTSNPTD